MRRSGVRLFSPAPVSTGVSRLRDANHFVSIACDVRADVSGFPQPGARNGEPGAAAGPHAASQRGHTLLLWLPTSVPQPRLALAGNATTSPGCSIRAPPQDAGLTTLRRCARCLGTAAAPLNANPAPTMKRKWCRPAARCWWLTRLGSDSAGTLGVTIVSVTRPFMGSVFLWLRAASILTTMPKCASHRRRFRGAPQ